MRNEAVHLLLLNKQNVGIEALKQAIGPILLQDEVFEQQLFQVSIQSRDIKNQVTFKLKDEFFPWLNPFHFINPSNHSAIYKMYESNGLKTKQIEEGLNDIVGDYMNSAGNNSPVN